MNDHQIIKLRIVGKRPLLMHSETLANPLNPITRQHKALTDKSGKLRTQEDQWAIAESEWRAGIYFDEEHGPHLPDKCLEASLTAGARRRKLGKAITRSVVFVDDVHPLEYDGPRTLKGLWDKAFYDLRTVKQGQSRIPRCRPMFTHWALNCTLAVDVKELDAEKVISAFSEAGLYCGIGDYRPKFGRFSVEVLSYE